ncbi:MAG: RibD family protein [Methanomicrobiales archaeon]
MGSKTVLKGFDANEGDIRDNVKEIREKKEKYLPDYRPLLVVTDSMGKVGVWAEVLEMSYIKDLLVLCSHSTPKKYIEFLKNNEVEYLIVGKDRINFKKALEELNDNFGIEIVRVDSGGTLNGILLRQGLVDEIRLLINPSLVGGISPSSIFQASDLKSVENVIELKLIEMEKMENDIVHLRYLISKRSS